MNVIFLSLNPLHCFSSIQLLCTNKMCIRYQRSFEEILYMYDWKWSYRFIYPSQSIRHEKESEKKKQFCAFSSLCFSIRCSNACISLYMHERNIWSNKYVQIYQEFVISYIIEEIFSTPFEKTTMMAASTISVLYWYKFSVLFIKEFKSTTSEERNLAYIKYRTGTNNKLPYYKSFVIIQSEHLNKVMWNSTSIILLALYIHMFLLQSLEITLRNRWNKDIIHPLFFIYWWRRGSFIHFTAIYSIWYHSGIFRIYYFE